MSKLTTFVALTALLIVTALPAYAYIGPGASAGVIATVLGILASIVMGFFAILWYPLKRLLKKRKAAREAGAAGGSGDGKSSTKP